MKGNKGITLIALVITIIVLLILAGVSIAMLSGDNSILTRAKSSAAQNEIAEGKDEVALAWNTAVANYLEDYYSPTSSGTSITDAFIAELGDFSTSQNAAKTAKAKFYIDVPTSSNKTVKIYSVSDNSFTVTGTFTDESSDTNGPNKGSLNWTASTP